MAQTSYRQEKIYMFCDFRVLTAANMKRAVFCDVAPRVWWKFTDGPEMTVASIIKAIRVIFQYETPCLPQVFGTRKTPTNIVHYRCCVDENGDECHLATGLR